MRDLLATMVAGPKRWRLARVAECLGQHRNYCHVLGLMEPCARVGELSDWLLITLSGPVDIAVENFVDNMPAS